MVEGEEEVSNRAATVDALDLQSSERDSILGRKLNLLALLPTGLENVSIATYKAIKATWPADTQTWPTRPANQGDVVIHLDQAMVDRLDALRAGLLQSLQRAHRQWLRNVPCYSTVIVQRCVRRSSAWAGRRRPWPDPTA